MIKLDNYYNHIYYYNALILNKQKKHQKPLEEFACG